MLKSHTARTFVRYAHKELKFGVDGRNVNELTHQRLTDIGRGPCFYDCLVDVAPDAAAPAA